MSTRIATLEQLLRDRLAAIRLRIVAAAGRAGRDPSEVTLVAVSKTHDAEMVASAYRAGMHLFGENRVEEAGPKSEVVARLISPSPPPAWHMIGHVQSRKARAVLPWAAMVHSVDTIKLARRLSSTNVKRGEDLPILLEINVSGEKSKYGFDPHDLVRAIETIAPLPGIEIQGLMTMAPIMPDPEEARPVFRALRHLRTDLIKQFPDLNWQHLSMGMTDDFEVAIEEGATIIRVGRAIFGQRA